MTDERAAVATPADAAPLAAGAARSRKRRIWRLLQVVVSIAIVVGIFAYAIPKVADYSQVWTVITRMTPLEVGLLFAVMIFNLFTYWWQNMAAIPGLGLRQAAVNNQTTTSVADTIPGGGYIAVGLAYTMYRSWGFTNSAIALSVAVTGVWNIFMKLALPILSLALLALGGGASAGRVVAALVGLAILVAAVALFALMLRRKAFARRIGSVAGRVASFFLRLLRRRPVEDWGEAAVRFRRQTIDLVAKRWLALTATTIVSHLALFAVLLLSIRFAGVSGSQVTWVEALAVFAFVRLLSAVPITPGGVGMVELGYVAGLAAAGGDHADVVAGTLVFRALTYGIQIPLGGFTYLVWRAKAGWRRDPPPETPVVAPGAAI